MGLSQNPPKLLFLDQYGHRLWVNHDKIQIFQTVTWLRSTRLLLPHFLHLLNLQGWLRNLSSNPVFLESKLIRDRFSEIYKDYFVLISWTLKQIQDLIGTAFILIRVHSVTNDQAGLSHNPHHSKGLANDIPELCKEWHRLSLDPALGSEYTF